MPKYDLVCQHCAKKTIYIQRYCGHTDMKTFKCGHCASTELNLVKYYESEIAEIKDLENRILDLKDRISDLAEYRGEPYDEDADVSPRGAYLN